MAEHTPTPWWVGEGGEIGAANIGQKYEKCVATCITGHKAEREANAAYIVRACNNYEGAMEACRAALDLTMSDEDSCNALQAALAADEAAQKEAVDD